MSSNQTGWSRGTAALASPGPNEIVRLKHAGDRRELSLKLPSGNAFSYTGCGSQRQAWCQSLELVPMLERRQGPHRPQTHGPTSHTPMPFTQSTPVTLSPPSVTKDSNTL